MSELWAAGQLAPRRERKGRPGDAWPALLLGIVLILPAATPAVAQLGWALLLAPALAATVLLRWNGVAIVALLAAGIGLRLAGVGVGVSDVLTVTVAAIERMLDGGNPYGVAYAESRPPGAPFPYGPLALLWYLPFRGNPVAVEVAASFLVLAALAIRGRAIGLAIFATAPVLVSTAGDGSNDNSLGLLLLAALLVSRRHILAGALLLGLATAFKPFAAAWIPPLLVWGGASAFVGVAAGALVAWGPAVLIWGAGPIMASVSRAQQIHTEPFYSLAAIVEGLTRRQASQPHFDGLRLLAGAFTALVSAPFVRTWSAVVLTGTAIYAVTLYTGFWSTFSYLAGLAPILCWQLDEWLGLSGRRVRWPGVDRVAATIERRWPARA